jgi:uncharacterized protein YceK
MIRLALIAACALALSGCAKVGTLDRPAPLFGEKAKAKYRAEKAAEAAAKAKPEDTGPEALPTNATAPDLPPESLPPVAPQ